METTDSGNETCRIENIGKFSVPICGHDVLTEFMVQDLRTRNNKGILFYGGLYANDIEERFFWYVSTLRPFSLEKIVSIANGGSRVREYFGEILQHNRMQNLYRAFEKPFFPKPEDDVDALVELDLLMQDEAGKIRITQKGIEMCNMLAHMTVNHRIKPPPDQLNEIFESFVRIEVWTPENQIPADTSLTVDRVMTLLSEKGELERLEQLGIDRHKLKDVIQLYLCSPF